MDEDVKHRSFLNKFRDQKWLYIFVAATMVGVCVLLLVLIFYKGSPLSQASLERRLADITVDTKGKVALMNILNAFHNDEQRAADRNATSSAEQLQRIQTTEGRLKGLTFSGDLKVAQDDLTSFFSQWDTTLSDGGDKREVSQQLNALARKYPWLNTILVLILLNSL